MIFYNRLLTHIPCLRTGSSQGRVPQTCIHSYRKQFTWKL